MAHADVRLDGHQMLGVFSTDDEKRYCNDDRNRRFFLDPGNDFNLNYGERFNDYTHRTRSGHNMNLNVYSWMRDHRQILRDSGILDTNRSRLNVDFVARRGILAKILEAGGNEDIDEGVAVTLYRGTYHIAGTGLGNPRARRGRAGENPNINKEMIAASSKLLFMFLTSKDGRTPDEPAPMNANASFYSVMKVNCGKHRMLVAAELQAERRVNADEPSPVCPNPRNYLNVRSRERNQIVHPMTTLRWWAKNAISGIPEIVYGLRDDEHRIIHGIEYIKTDRLTRMNYTGGRWQPGACIRTMDSLLTQIKELVHGDDPNTVYQEVLELDQNRSFRIRDRQDEDTAYIEELTIRGILESNVD